MRSTCAFEMAVAKLILLAVLIKELYTQYTFVPVNDSVGIQFVQLSNVFTTYNEWTLCYYYELDNYGTIIERIRNNIKHLKQICDDLKKEYLPVIVLRNIWTSN